MNPEHRLAVEPHPLGSILPLRAHAGARRNAIEGVHNGALRVSVTAAADKGQANRAILELLSKTLGVARSTLTLIAGTTSRQKKVLIAGIAAEELDKRLQAHLDAPP